MNESLRPSVPQQGCFEIAHDILAEGPLWKNSRGDWTPIELFATGAGELAGSLRAFVLAA